MAEVIYATVVRDDKWDSQDEHYFYKKYVFSKLQEKDAQLLETLLTGNLPLAPFSFRHIKREKRKKFPVIVHELAIDQETINVKFNKKDSEVVKEDKPLFFFF